MTTVIKPKCTQLRNKCTKLNPNQPNSTPKKKEIQSSKQKGRKTNFFRKHRLGFGRPTISTDTHKPSKKEIKLHPELQEENEKPATFYANPRAKDPRNSIPTAQFPAQLKKRKTTNTYPAFLLKDQIKYQTILTLTIQIHPSKPDPSLRMGKKKGDHFF